LSLFRPVDRDPNCFLVTSPQGLHPNRVTQVETAYQLLNDGDAQQAIASLQRGATAGDPASLFELGIWYLEGRHLQRDLRRSRECFRQAGELGEKTAEHVYICFLANGIGGEANWQAAKEQLRKLAESDAKAARQIAVIETMELDDRGYPRTRPVGHQLSTTPEVWRFDDFASSAECLYLIETAQPLLQQSVVVDPVTGQFRPHPIRTSEGAIFPWVSEDLAVTALNRRIAMASGTDASCGEPLQVLRYRPGQEYRPHLDALPGGENQRVLTMLVYLNENYDGGETLFTRTGLKYAGKAGDGLLFRNADPDGIPDRNAEHAGLPVLAGKKFVASRWIRERPMIAP
jgi:prolyl 4-hydroxylase